MKIRGNKCSVLKNQYTLIMFLGFRDLQKCLHVGKDYRQTSLTSDISWVLLKMEIFVLTKYMQGKQASYCLGKVSVCST